MVWSNDFQFEVYLVNPKLPENQNQFKEMTTPEGLYVIANTGDEFQIVINAEDRNFYVAVVIIDGYKIPQDKKFRRSGKITGFRTGPGEMRSFIFQRPQADPLSMNKFSKNPYFMKKLLEVTNCHTNDRTDYMGAPGEIVIKIYKTEQVERRPPNPNRPPREPKEFNDPIFQPFTFNDEKKGLDQTLGVGMGEPIQTESGGGDRPPREPRPEDNIGYKGIINEDGLVASFRFQYTDAMSLIQKRFINLDYPQHLTLLPGEYFKNNERAIIQAFQTIIRGARSDVQEGTTMEEILNRCQFWIKCPIFDLLGKDLGEADDSFRPQDEELIRQFFKTHDKYFVEDTQTQQFKVGASISKKLGTSDLEEGEI